MPASNASDEFDDVRKKEGGLDSSLTHSCFPSSRKKSMEEALG